MEKKNSLVLVALVSLIYLSSACISICLSQTMQVLDEMHHLGSALFAKLSLLVNVGALGFVFVSCLAPMQNVYRQRYLLLLLLLVMGVLLLDFSSGSLRWVLLKICSKGISGLASAWRQLLVPPAYRGILEGINSTFLALIGFGTIATQNFLAKNPWIYVYFGGGFLVLFVVFFQKTKNALSEIPSPLPMGILDFLKQNKELPLLVVFAGINNRLFNYAYTLGEDISHGIEVNTYQYALQIGSVLFPLMIGRIADKAGLLRVTIWVCWGTLLCKVMALVFVGLPSVPWSLYFGSKLLAGGFACSIGFLPYCLAGNKFAKLGIFRAMGVLTPFAILGASLADGVYSVGLGHYNSYPITMAGLLLLDSALLFWVLKVIKSKTQGLPIRG